MMCACVCVCVCVFLLSLTSPRYPLLLSLVAYLYTSSQDEFYDELVHERLAGKKLYTCVAVRRQSTTNDDLEEDENPDERLGQYAMDRNIKRDDEFYDVY